MTSVHTSALHFPGFLLGPASVNYNVKLFQMWLAFIPNPFPVINHKNPALKCMCERGYSFILIFQPRLLDSYRHVFGSHISRHQKHTLNVNAIFGLSSQLCLSALMMQRQTAGQETTKKSSLKITYSPQKWNQIKVDILQFNIIDIVTFLITHSHTTKSVTP